ncbi:Zn-dependent alcohol dehydrogenase GroES-like protein (plasmid) [Rhizobium phaseoli]|uniref:Zn-dependent alcohol dehydrogenase GroES-like protein n=1 Tax=Rhizobium phaseoli TaxID=396 RepID=A0ABM6CL82_9HYPH|nr:zinc-binding dehydrogenase [Rhizobium phaseoli]ANL30194.1 Zn-dependent alcohol dehydrogenase GroES-like protein [Rhizobium phaseoli]ANL89146.1 Zn-dependent alcohol dehydrogenase GroES-like protein [Rhizobium phaseoli]ANL95655.1 Zn-dependent alcohol dehydrogenase GroES-like protein [Rhizobium phaseoli]
MKAVIVDAAGDPKDVVKLGDVDEPISKSGEAIVRVTKRVVHAADHQAVRGVLSRQFFSEQGIPGIDGVGVIESFGTEALADQQFAVGSRVGFYPTRGTWAERVAMPLGTLVQLPDDIGDAVLSQLLTNGMAALLLLSAAIQANGETGKDRPILVSAATSTVGRIFMTLAAIQNRKVIGLVRRGDAVDAIQHDFPGTAAINTSVSDWQDRLKAAAGGDIGVVVDPVGGALLPALLGVLAPSGTAIVYGGLDPRPSPISTLLITARGLTIKGLSSAGLASAMPAAERAACFKEIFEAARQKPHIFDVETEYPLAEAARAVELSEVGPRRGAIILTS